MVYSACACRSAFFNYGDIIKLTLNTISKQRWLPSEIRLINQIWDIIDKSDGTIEFENEQAKYITDTINQAGLPVRGKEAELFLNDLDEMNKQK